MKRHACLAALIALAGALGGCSATASPTTTNSTPVGSSAAAANAPPSVASLSPVEGTWETGAIPQATIETTLRNAALGNYVNSFEKVDGTPASRAFTLKVAGGSWTLLRGDDGAAPGVVDRGTYTLTGNQISYAPNSGSVDVYTFAVANDQLALTFVSTTEPDFNGLPNEVFQRAFYTSAPFHRAAA